MLTDKNFFPGAGDAQEVPFEGLIASLADALPMGILITDADSRCVYSNAAYQRLSGRTAEEVNGSFWSSVIHPQDHLGVIRRWQDCLQKQTPFQCEARMKQADGQHIWTRRHISEMPEGMPGRFYVHTVEDISVKKAKEALMARFGKRVIDEEMRAQVMLDFIGDALICTDTHNHITYLNRVAEKLTGFSRDEALGLPLPEVFWVLDAESREPRPDPARRAMDSNSVVPLHNNALMVARNGFELAIEDSATPIHNRKREVVGAVTMFHDSRYSAETTARMAHLAQHDLLTGLLNRFGFAERFNQSLALATRHTKPMGVLFIELDNFKDINDTLGHDSGDKILRELANKLVSSVRATDTVCRHGGDEFVVLLNEIARADNASAVADKVREAVASALMVLDGTEVTLKVSIGVSVYPDNGNSLEMLLRHADAAMLQVKTSRKRHESEEASYSYTDESQRPQA
ncbi:sensor domain-containing protein [Marinobacter changyiensis]|uniref:sensor domain-containing protein n=1 Tax=Marinobacter changyiensis TaxID=2604091 RepID=UPI0012648CB7|nr:diguanylate cyclase [Marinobacter changyiensis]